jgi:hypothetical protein
MWVCARDTYYTGNYPEGLSEKKFLREEIPTQTECPRSEDVYSKGKLFHINSN